MAGVNKAILVGNLGADPELKYTTGGQSVCDLRIATSRKFKDRQDAWQEDTQWHRVVVWGKQAEHCNEYLSKGRQVYVEGRLQTRQWEDKDGHRHYTTEVVAQTVQFLGGKGEQRGGGGYGAGGDRPPGSPPSQDPDDDIPFAPVLP